MSMKKLIYVLLVPLLFACGSDDPEPVTIPEIDFRTFGEGNYDYSALVTSKEDRNITQNIEGDLSVEILTGTTMKMTMDGEVYTLNAIVEASNGFAFNLVSKTLIDGDGDEFEVKGFTSVTFEGVSYHGHYDSGSDQFFLNIESDYVEDEYDIYNVEIEVIGSR